MSPKDYPEWISFGESRKGHFKWWMSWKDYSEIFFFGVECIKSESVMARWLDVSKRLSWVTILWWAGVKSHCFGQNQQRPKWRIHLECVENVFIFLSRVDKSIISGCISKITLSDYSLVWRVLRVIFLKIKISGVTINLFLGSIIVTDYCSVWSELKVNVSKGEIVRWKKNLHTQVYAALFNLWPHLTQHSDIVLDNFNMTILNSRRCVWDCVRC